MTKTNLNTFQLYKKISLAIKLTLTFAAIIAFSAILSSCKKNSGTSNLNLRSKTIVLIPIGANLQSGTAVFLENADHSFNVQINLTNTVMDTVMSIDIHNGNHTSMKYHALELHGVKGTGGNVSYTTSNINMIYDANAVLGPVTYDQIIVYPGVVNISYSYAQDSRHLAYGDIQQ